MEQSTWLSYQTLLAPVSCITGKHSVEQLANLDKQKTNNAYTRRVFDSFILSRNFALNVAIGILVISHVKFWINAETSRQY